MKSGWRPVLPRRSGLGAITPTHCRRRACYVLLFFGVARASGTSERRAALQLDPRCNGCASSLYHLSSPDTPLRQTILQRPAPPPEWPGNHRICRRQACRRRATGVPSPPPSCGVRTSTAGASTLPSPSTLSRIWPSLRCHCMARGLARKKGYRCGSPSRISESHWSGLEALHSMQP